MLNLVRAKEKMTGVRLKVWKTLIKVDLRRGLISLEGLAWSTRALLITGLALAGIMILVLLFSGGLRAAQPLVPLAAVGDGVRGLLLPRLIVPLTLFVMALAWSFILSGVLHCPFPLRLAALLLYLTIVIPLMTSPFTAMLIVSFREPLVPVDWGLALFFLLATAGILIIVMLMLSPRPVIAAPALNFSLILAAVTLTLALIQRQNTLIFYTLGLPQDSHAVKDIVDTVSYLIIPFLVMVGLKLADFTVRVSNWTTAAIKHYLPSAAIYALLAGLLGLRLLQVGSSSLEEVRLNGMASALGPYGGALIEVLLVWAAAWLVWRLLWSDLRLEVSVDKLVETVAAYAMPLIFAFVGFHIFVMLIPIMISFLPVFEFIGLGGIQETIRAGTELSGSLIQYDYVWRGLIAVAAFFAAVSRRKSLRLGSLYLILFGVFTIWGLLTFPGSWLDLFSRRSPDPLDFWWLLLLTTLGLYWLSRGQLDHSRAGRLLLLTILLTLLRQTAFIKNPFSPFLAFSGIGMLAVGITWDMLKIGTWANKSTTALPRLGRLLLYTGYVLLSVGTINWVLASHNLTVLQRFTGEFAVLGLKEFGYPLLYALFPLLLWPTAAVKTSLAGFGKGEGQKEKRGPA